MNEKNDAFYSQLLTKIKAGDYQAFKEYLLTTTSLSSEEQTKKVNELCSLSNALLKHLILWGKEPLTELPFDTNYFIFKTELIEKLSRFLDHPDPSVVAYILKLMSMLNTKEVYIYITKFIDTHNLLIKKAAIEALFNLKFPWAREYLIEYYDKFEKSIKEKLDFMIENSFAEFEPQIFNFIVSKPSNKTAKSLMKLLIEKKILVAIKAIFSIVTSREVIVDKFWQRIFETIAVKVEATKNPELKSEFMKHIKEAFVKSPADVVTFLVKICFLIDKKTCKEILKFALLNSGYESQISIVRMLVRMDQELSIIILGESFPDLSITSQEIIVNFFRIRSDELSFEYLLKGLRTPYPEIQRKIYKALEKDRRLATYLNNLTAKEPNIRYGALMMVQQLGDRQVQKEVEARLRDPDLNVRLLAIEVLDKFLKSKVVKVLLNYLDDPAPEFICKCLNVISKYPSNEASGSIISLIDHENQDICNLACEYIMDRYLNIFLDLSKEIKEIIGKIMKKVASRYENFFEILEEKFESESKRERETVVSILEYLYSDYMDNDKVTALLLRCLTDIDSEIKIKCLKILRKNVSKDLFPILLHLLSDRDIKVIGEVMSIFELMGKENKITLIQALSPYLESDDSRVKAYVGVLLMNLGYREAFDVIINMLLQENYSIRMSAINALNFSKDENTLKVIVPALQDSSPNVRLAALKILKSKYDIKKLRKIITPLLNDQNSRIRQESRKVMKEFES